MKNSQYYEIVSMLWLIIAMSVDVEVAGIAWLAWFDFSLVMVALALMVMFGVMAKRAAKAEKKL